MSQGRRMWEQRQMVSLSDSPLGLNNRKLPEAVKSAMPSDVILLWCHDCLESWLMPIEIAMTYPNLHMAQGALALCAQEHDDEGVCKPK